MSKTTLQTSAPTPLARITAILPWILIVCGIVGIIAAFAITQDKFRLAANASFQPACDLNPIISCGSVMKSPQSHVFGFTNTYIGLIGFPILVTTGVAMLAGAQFKRWWWRGMQIGLTLGTIFAYWLLFESIFRIHALCPWCLSVDVVITAAWWYQSLYNFYHGHLPLPTALKQTGRFVKRHHVDILVFWYLLVIAFILQHFWYYFGQHL